MASLDYTCPDICNACPGDWVNFNGMTCDCGWTYKREAPTEGEGLGDGSDGFEEVIKSLKDLKTAFASFLAYVSQIPRMLPCFCETNG